MKDLFVKGLTSALYVAAVIGSLWFGPILFYSLLLIFLAVGLFEMQKILGRNRVSPWLIAVPALWYVAGVLEQFGARDVQLCYFIVFFVWFSLLLIRKPQAIVKDITRLGALFLYPTISFFLVSRIAGGPETWDPVILWSTFLLIWSNDTFAYLTGQFLGRRPLAPRISPNKTMEGLLGGLFFMLLLAFNLHRIFPQQGPVYWSGFGLLVGITCNIGDLFESWLKRHRGIKDSGIFLPGHGGILDRLDSFIFSVPFIYMYCRIAAAL